MSQGSSYGPAAKRRRPEPALTFGKRYKGKPQRLVNKRSNRSLRQQVATLSKIVKQDHTTIIKSLDYADFLYPAVSTVPVRDVWNHVQLMQPVLWSPTLRRSNLSDTAVEATIVSVNIELLVIHGAADVCTTNWTFVLFRAKGDWIPGSPSLRPALDFVDMGSGNNPALNQDFFKVLKRFDFRTKARSVGDMEHTSTPKRSLYLKMNYPLKRVPTTTALGDTTWKNMTDSDFTRPDKLYFAWYCNNLGSQAFTVSPALTFTTKFSVKML